MEAVTVDHVKIKWIEAAVAVDTDPVVFEKDGTGHSGEGRSRTGHGLNGRENGGAMYMMETGCNGEGGSCEMLVISLL